MTDLITIIILFLVLGGAIYYIIKSKKNGNKCIGCPSGSCCLSKNGGGSCDGSCNIKEQ